jgi:fructokinase
LGPELCVMTLGSEDDFFRVAGGGEPVAPFRVKAVDVTGCGDAFVAWLIRPLIRSGDWQEQLTVARMREVLRYANAVGTPTSMTLGVIPALPTSEQVDEFLVQVGG